MKNFPPIVIVLENAKVFPLKSERVELRGRKTCLSISYSVCIFSSLSVLYMKICYQFSRCNEKVFFTLAQSNELQTWQFTFMSSTINDQPNEAKLYALKTMQIIF